MAVVMLVAVILLGCQASPDEATQRFDRAFWEVWFMHMSDADRKAVCWQPPEEAARDYAAAFDAGYLRAEQRAETLFTRACAGVYP